MCFSTDRGARKKSTYARTAHRRVRLSVSSSSSSSVLLIRYDLVVRLSNYKIGKYLLRYYVTRRYTKGG